MTGAPIEPLIPTIGAHTGLPEDAQQLLARGRIPFADACAFLGIDRTLGYAMARRYIKRTAKIVAGGKPWIRAHELMPQRDKDGRWRELPAYQVGHKYVVRADLLVRMIYPEVAP